MEYSSRDLCYVRIGQSGKQMPKNQRVSVLNSGTDVCIALLFFAFKFLSPDNHFRLLRFKVAET